MNDFEEPTATEVDSYYLKVKKDAESSGYHLNPDVEFTKELLKSILINIKPIWSWSLSLQTCFWR